MLIIELLAAKNIVDMPSPEAADKVSEAEEEDMPEAVDGLYAFTT